MPVTLSPNLAWVLLLVAGLLEIVDGRLAAGLVDELRLMIYPVVLGAVSVCSSDNEQAPSFHPWSFDQHAAVCARPIYARSGALRSGALEDAE